MKSICLTIGKDDWLMQQELVAPWAGADIAPDGDARLMEYITQGERWAFKLLVQRHNDRFYRVAYRFTGNREAAEDVVQEAFLKLWERPMAWEIERNVKFTTWFYRVVVNLCLDLAKKKKPLLMENNGWIEDVSDSQEQSALQRERERLVEKEIAALPQRQRVAINLCFYEELSNQEAADIMGLNLKAFQSLVMRGKMTLQNKLRGKLGD